MCMQCASMACVRCLVFHSRYTVPLNVKYNVDLSIGSLFQRDLLTVHRLTCMMPKSYATRSLFSRKIKKSKEPKKYNWTEWMNVNGIALQRKYVIIYNGYFCTQYISLCKWLLLLLFGAISHKQNKQLNFWSASVCRQQRENEKYYEGINGTTWILIEKSMSCYVYAFFNLFNYFYFRFHFRKNWRLPIPNY